MTDSIQTYTELLRWANEAGVGFNETDWEFLDGSTPAKWGDMILDLLADEVKAGRITQEESDSWAILHV